MASDFIRNNKIQAAIISYLKSKTSLTSVLANGSDEIRENSWKGTTFKYPNVRVELVSNKPKRPGCPQDIEYNIQVFSESPSSLESDEIAGIIVDILHLKQFTSNDIAFASYASDVRPAFEVSETVWQSVCMMRATVS